MLDKLSNRSTPVLKEEKRRLEKTRDKCADIFKGMHADEAWDALVPIDDALCEIEKELERRGC